MKDKISKKEFAWYVISGGVILFGLIVMVLGIVGHHLPGSLENNFIRNAEKAMNLPLDFRAWGMIFLAIGVVLLAIVLAFNARKTDRDVERQVRRQQRISSSNSTIEVKAAVEVVEEPSPSVEEKK